MVEGLKALLLPSEIKRSENHHRHLLKFMIKSDKNTEPES